MNYYWLEPGQSDGSGSSQIPGSGSETLLHSDLTGSQAYDEEDNVHKHPPGSYDAISAKNLDQKKNK